MTGPRDKKHAYTVPTVLSNTRITYGGQLEGNRQQCRHCCCCRSGSSNAVRCWNCTHSIYYVELSGLPCVLLFCFSDFDFISVLSSCHTSSFVPTFRQARCEGARGPISIGVSSFDRRCGLPPSQPDHPASTLSARVCGRQSWPTPTHASPISLGHNNRRDRVQ